MIRSKQFARKLLLSFGSILLTLLVLEIVFRISNLRGEYHRPYVDVLFAIKGKTVEQAPFGFYTNSAIVSHYDSDPRGYFEMGNTIAHESNSVGWRDREHSLEKPSSVFRILGLGDSYLWGQGVKRNDVCLAKLSRILQDTIPDKDVETINAGVSAFNTENQFDQLKNVGLAYNPDLVILHFVLNDVEQDVYRAVGDFE